MMKICLLEISLVESSQAIRNRSRKNCRPGEGAWTLREGEIQTPIRRNRIRKKTKKVTSLRRMMRRLGKNTRTPEKKGWAVEERLRELKKRGLGLIILLIYFFPPLFICHNSDFRAISKISCKYSLCDCTWITLILLNICLVPKYICCLH